MMTQQEKRLNLYSRLLSIKNVSAAQMDAETDSVGISFNYLGVLYTAYVDTETERAELLQHDPIDLSQVVNIGSSTATQLIAFFEGLPTIQSICK